jgi:hypothetical protein
MPVTESQEAGNLIDALTELAGRNQSLGATTPAGKRRMIAQYGPDRAEELIEEKISKAKAQERTARSHFYRSRGFGHVAEVVPPADPDNPTPQEAAGATIRRVIERQWQAFEAQHGKAGDTANKRRNAYKDQLAKKQLTRHD